MIPNHYNLDFSATFKVIHKPIITYNSHNMPCDPNHLILTSKEDFPVLPVLLSDFQTFQDPTDSKGGGTASAPKVQTVHSTAVGPFGTLVENTVI